MKLSLLFPALLRLGCFWGFLWRNTNLPFPVRRNGGLNPCVGMFVGTSRFLPRNVYMTATAQSLLSKTLGDSCGYRLAA